MNSSKRCTTLQYPPYDLPYVSHLILRTAGSTSEYSHVCACEFCTHQQAVSDGDEGKPSAWIIQRYHRFGFDALVLKNTLCGGRILRATQLTRLAALWLRVVSLCVYWWNEVNPNRRWGSCGSPEPGNIRWRVPGLITQQNAPQPVLEFMVLSVLSDLIETASPYNHLNRFGRNHINTWNNDNDKKSMPRYDVDC